MNVNEVINYRFDQIEQSYSERDAILYALATGDWLRDATA